MAHSDVSIVAAGGVEKFSQSAATDTGRGTLLLNAVAMLASGDHLILGPGGFDVGTNLIVVQANNVVISGSGPTTVILGQPPGDNAVFRAACDDIELYNLQLVANGGSGFAFGTTTGKPSGDRFIARNVRMTGIRRAIETVTPNQPPRISRWWDCEVVQESNLVSSAVRLGEHDRADFYGCRFYSRTISADLYAVFSDTQRQQVQRFYNCECVAESASGLIKVAQSRGFGFEFYGGRLVATQTGNPSNYAGDQFNPFAAITNLQDGESVIEI